MTDAVTGILASNASKVDVEDFRLLLLSLVRLKKRGVVRDDSVSLATLIAECLRPQLRRLETRELLQISFACAELNALDGPLIRERLIPTLRKRLAAEPTLRHAALSLQLLDRLPFSCSGGGDLKREAVAILEAASSDDVKSETTALAAGAVCGANVWELLEQAGPEPFEKLKDGEFRALAEAAAKAGRLLHAVKVERLRRSIK
jgi:hypothetical protein